VLLADKGAGVGMLNITATMPTGAAGVAGILRSAERFTENTAGWPIVQLPAFGGSDGCWFWF
jgi:hypothetical protein